MKKTIVILIGVALVAIVCFALRGRNAQNEQVTLQIDSTESVEVAWSNTTTNLHFENLHAYPQLQQ